MIFKQWEQVVGLKEPPKGQTRRPVKEREYGLDERGFPIGLGNAVHSVFFPNGRLKWQVGRTYAIQRPDGRTVGRFLLTKIRREPLQDISEEDAKAEGVQLRELYGMDYIPGWQSLGDDRYFTEEQRVTGLRGAFALLWDLIYPKDHNWLERPGVWVLEWPPVEVSSG